MRVPQEGLWLGALLPSTFQYDATCCPDHNTSEEQPGGERTAGKGREGRRDVRGADAGEQLKEM